MSGPLSFEAEQTGRDMGKGIRRVGWFCFIGLLLIANTILVVWSYARREKS